jgi:2-oxoglutarate ferredoxin oxidoreductase subunit delta
MKYRVSVDHERCKGCELCVGVCPRKVLAMGGRLNAASYRSAQTVNEQDCIGCEQCALICPDAAIMIEELDPATTERGRKTKAAKVKPIMAEQVPSPEVKACPRGC